MSPFIDSQREADALVGLGTPEAEVAEYIRSTQGPMEGRRGTSQAFLDGLNATGPLPEDLRAQHENAMRFRELADTVESGYERRGVVKPEPFAPAFQGRLPESSPMGSRAQAKFDVGNNYDPNRFSPEAEQAYAMTREDREATNLHKHLSSHTSGHSPVVNRELLFESPELVDFLSEENIAALGRGGEHSYSTHRQLVNILRRTSAGIDAEAEAHRIQTRLIARHARMAEAGDLGPLAHDLRLREREMRRLGRRN